ncbi:MAG: hypothetical protein ACXWUG_15660 [Polyangiales bacterium]
MKRSNWRVALAAIALAIGCNRQLGHAGSGPKPPAYDPDSSKCSVTKSQSRPLIVEWSSPDRGSLEALKNKGLVVVRYSGCEMEILRGCKAPGVYGYTPFTTKRDRVTIRTADDLYANVPMGAAKLEAKLEQSGELNVSMTIVGTYEADKTSIKAEELQGSCDGATHYVTAITAGSFEFSAGAEQAASASAGVVGIGGAGGSTKSKHEILSRDGDDAACAKATLDDKAPPAGCGALLRLEVTPIAGAAPPPTTVAATGPAEAGGTVSDTPPGFCLKTSYNNDCFRTKSKCDKQLAIVKQGECHQASKIYCVQWGSGAEYCRETMEDCMEQQKTLTKTYVVTSGCGGSKAPAPKPQPTGAIQPRQHCLVGPTVTIDCYPSRKKCDDQLAAMKVTDYQCKSYDKVACYQGGSDVCRPTLDECKENEDIMRKTWVIHQACRVLP